MHDAAISALLAARDYDAACDAVGREAVDAAVIDLRLPILAAPEIALLVEEWMALRRLRAAEDDLITGRGVVLDALRTADPDAETDTIAPRARALSVLADSQTRMARTRIDLHRSLEDRITRVAWRLWQLRQSTPTEARDRLLGYLACASPSLDTALALARVWRLPARPVVAQDGVKDAATGLPVHEGLRAALEALAARAEGSGDLAVAVSAHGRIAELTDAASSADPIASMTPEQREVALADTLARLG